jgi:hypothetical protein
MAEHGVLNVSDQEQSDLAARIRYQLRVAAGLPSGVYLPGGSDTSR